MAVYAHIERKECQEQEIYRPLWGNFSKGLQLLPVGRFIYIAASREGFEDRRFKKYMETIENIIM